MVIKFQTLDIVIEKTGQEENCQCSKSRTRLDLTSGGKTKGCACMHL